MIAVPTAAVRGDALGADPVLGLSPLFSPGEIPRGCLGIPAMLRPRAHGARCRAQRPRSGPDTDPPGPSLVAVVEVFGRHAINNTRGPSDSVELSR